ncbi:uncharacterized protein LOC116439879 [Corvus moneduloides]|uniref:uncharacterized protein LOC116439879 n=1 Tax=Corvus moneduloides TaxID=1196302 RepID=UPI00136207AE|nr:uncharacterized protein LOC116439879 [Corvus moneduloides]
MSQWEEEVETFQETSPRGSRTCRVLRRWQVHTEVWELSQCTEGTQRELHQMETTVTVQELRKWAEDGQTFQEVREWQERVAHQEVSQWEEAERGQQETERDEHETSQELSLWRAPEDSPWEDVPEPAQGEAEWDQAPSQRGDLHSPISPEEHQREAELSPGRDSNDKELSRGPEDRAQELSQREQDVTSSTGDKPLGPVMEKEPQPCSPEGPGSRSPAGTAVAAEAAPALPSASPAPGSATEAEPAAAAPGLQEEPPEALAAQQEEKAAESPVPSEELPSLSTQSPPSVPFNTPASSLASLCRDQSSPGQLLSQVLLELQAEWQQLEEQASLEQWRAAGAAGTAPVQREQSPVPGKSDMEEELSQREGEHQAQLSQEERNNCHGLCQGEERSEKDMSHREANSSQELSDWEEHVGKELSQGDVISQEDISDWEEHIGQGLSQQEASLGQDVSPGNGHTPSAHSSWEDDSHQELAQDLWEVRTDSGIWMKPLAPEEDEWDEISILELPPEENNKQNQGGFAALGLPVPVPREAWVEGPAPEPCSPGPLCASPAALQGRGPVGHAASPAFEEPVLEAGTESPVPAPRKRPSRFRRALRGLFRCPCLAPQPEE